MNNFIESQKEKRYSVFYEEPRLPNGMNNTNNPESCQAEKTNHVKNIIDGLHNNLYYGNQTGSIYKTKEYRERLKKLTISPSVGYTPEYSNFLSNSKKLDAEILKYFIKHLLYKNYGTTIDEKHCVYCTQEQLAKEFNRSVRTIRRSLKRSQKKCLLEIIQPVKNEHSYYHIPIEGLAYAMGVSIQIKSAKTEQKVIHSPVENYENGRSYEVEQGGEIYQNVRSDVRSYNITESCYKSYKSKKEKKEKRIDRCSGDSLVDPKRISEPAKKPPTENQNSPTRVQTKYDNIVLDCTQAIAEEFHPDKYLHMRVFLTKKLARFIHAAIKFKFNYSLEAFRRYLQQVKASIWIKFKFSIEWILDFETINKILYRKRGAKEEKMPLHQKDPELEFKQAYAHIESVDESSICKKIREKIIELRSAFAYNSWFTKISLTAIDDKVYINHPESLDNFTRDYINNHFRDTLDTLGISFV